MNMDGRTMGRCQSCGRRLLLNPENSLCISCELDALKRKIIQQELIIAQYRREKKIFYKKLEKLAVQA